MTALQVKLTSGEEARALLRETDNPEAYEIYLRGRERRRHLGKTFNAEAKELFEKAVALAQDPESLHLLRKELRPMIKESALCRAEDWGRNFCNLMTDVVQRHALR